MNPPRPLTPAQVLRKCPRLVAHVIAASLGYATPSLAAQIVADAHVDRPNGCEWIACCYRGSARAAVARAVRNRRYHRDPMADHRRALALVRQAAATGDEPVFASWF